MFGWFKRRREQSERRVQALNNSMADMKRHKSSTRRSSNDDFDASGFALGMMTGVPLSPTYGVSTGSILGSALHSSPPSPSVDAPSSAPEPPSSSSDSYSSSSGSTDSPSFSDGGSAPSSSD